MQQYFSTQSPEDQTETNKGVPMLTYDEENNAIVMEYLSPEGEQVEHEDNTNNIPSFLSTMDRVFEPSSKTSEADWFVINANGTRQKTDQLIEAEFEAAEAQAAQVATDIGIEVERDGEDNLYDEDTTERITVGDFVPIIGPDDSLVAWIFIIDNQKCLYTTSSFSKEINSI